MFEAKLVVQSLRINTLSKLTFSDSARFDGLLRDVFPGVEFKDIEYESLAEAIRAVCKESNLAVNEAQVGWLFSFTKQVGIKAEVFGKFQLLSVAADQMLLMLSLLASYCL